MKYLCLLMVLCLAGCCTCPKIKYEIQVFETNSDGMTRRDISRRYIIVPLNGKP